jgi:predicted nucleic acid-binding protein
MAILVIRPKYYWDACAWIGLIQQEPDKIGSLRHVMELAQKGQVEIWTSAFTLAEVFKRRCGGDQVGLNLSDDSAFEDYLTQDYVQRVQVDVDVGTAARRLLRRYPQIRKPQDAIHAATAALNNIDELHTFDGDDLLPMDGLIPMQNGDRLKICRPPNPPEIPRDPHPFEGTMFEPLIPSSANAEIESLLREENRRS